MKRLIAVGLAILITTPAFACGPMTGNTGQTGGTNTQPQKKRPQETQTARQQWAKKRMQQLKRRRSEDHRIQGKIDLIEMDMGSTPKRSSGQARAYMIDRFEFLALKKERRGITSAEAAEMKLILNTLRRTQ